MQNIEVDGCVYTGWWDTHMHGYGVCLWPDGAKYDGMWDDGKKAGLGRCILANGDMYEGDWLQDRATG